MKEKTIKNLEKFAIPTESMTALKGGLIFTNPLGGGSRPMRPTMSAMSTYIQP